MAAAAHKIINRIKNTDKTDYYKVLAVSRSATEREIKTAYRKLALKLHPDRCKLKGAAEAFKVVGSAYAVLSDADKKRQYDRFGVAGEGGSPFGGGGGFTRVDPEQIFREVFGAQFGGDGFSFNFGNGGGGVFRGSDLGGNTFVFGRGIDMASFMNNFKENLDRAEETQRTRKKKKGTRRTRQREEGTRRTRQREEETRRTRQREQRREPISSSAQETVREVHPQIPRWMVATGDLIRKYPFFFLVAIILGIYAMYQLFAKLMGPIFLVLIFVPAPFKKYILAILAVMAFMMSFVEIFSAVTPQ